MIVSGAGHLTGGVVQGRTMQGDASGVGRVVGGMAAAYGTPGKDGGYYTPKIIMGDDGSILFSFEPSNENMTPVDDIQIILPSGGSSADIGTVDLLAANWVGSDNLYSQVVDITGVTENSQVDLTPSVEQLVVFYEKDLTFVTENENGVVTVYAIGQKPENDYTIQVTITEVRNYE